MATQAVEEALADIGRTLSSLRKEAGYTQNGLAKSIGFQRSTVAGAESGKGAGIAFWEQCDRVLKAQGKLVAAFQEIEEIRRREQDHALQADRTQRLSIIQQWRQPHDNMAAHLPISFSVRSNKFIAAFIGTELASTLTLHKRAEAACPPEWTECYSIKIGHSTGSCILYIWPYGSIVFHLVEEQEFSSIAELAVWRIRSYQENLAWASAQLSEMTATQGVSASYVLSAYWLNSPTWKHDHIDTALRIMCTPRVLLSRDLCDHEDPQQLGVQVEHKLLSDGYENPEIAYFGLNGISHGFASWSGVVYHPIAPDRALKESEIMSCELATQALWVYCQYINGQIEEGRDPLVGCDYSWRFLRGARSRLVNPRPQETGQHRSMRDAIIKTSGLIGHLDQAIESLRQQ